MKILQLVTRRQYRGAEVAAATFSEEFIRYGHEVIFAGLYKPPTAPLQVAGATIVDIGVGSGFLSFRGLWRLVKLIRKEKPDILHANGSDTLKYLAAAKVFIPSGIVVYRNISIISHWRGENPLKNSFYSLLFRQVDYITSVGDTSKNDFIRTFPFSANKIAVVRRGIRIPENTRKSSAREELGIDATRKVLIHVGNFSPEKDHAFLIEAFAEIKKSNTAAVLLLIGDGPLRFAVEAHVKELQLTNDIFFLGLKEDISPYVAIADLILLTSRVEGVPGVLLEAAAQNVPAVALTVGGVGESVRHNETGVLVAPGNVNRFSEQVIDLLVNHSERARLGSNAGRFVKENHDLRRNAKEFISIFEDLLNGRQ